MTVNIFDTVLKEYGNVVSAVVTHNNAVLKEISEKMKIIEKETSQRDKKRKSYDQKKKGLLGVEEIAREKLESLAVEESSAIEALNEQWNNLRGQYSKIKTENSTIEELSERYMGISTEPLKWRNKTGYPTLILFTLQEPLVVFTLPGFYETCTYKPSRMPVSLREHYSDVSKVLVKKRLQPKEWLYLKAQFQGVIPEVVKEKVVQAKKDFGENIFILAEQKEWSLEKIIPVDEDPLVVGFDCEAPNVLWLIDKFDTTPIEDVVASLKI